MATLAQLQAEVWWGREFVPPEMQLLISKLRAFFQVGAVAIGSKGDTNHLRGYHRSRNWVKNSKYCTNRTYSVSETPGNRDGGNDDWLCAIDISLDQKRLLPLCQRLDVAVRSGTLEKVTEWYGNINGDQRVDGYNNIRNVLASSDSSHLFHCHISLDRGRAGESHTDLYQVLTAEDFVTKNELVALLKDPEVAAELHKIVYNGKVSPDDKDLAYLAWAGARNNTVQILELLQDGVTVPEAVNLTAEAVAAVADAVADQLRTDPERDGPNA